MNPKTYLPGLYYAMLALNHYAAKYSAKLGANMTDQQRTCFNSLLQCLADCLPLFIPPAPSS